MAQPNQPQTNKGNYNQDQERDIQKNAGQRSDKEGSPTSPLRNVETERSPRKEEEDEEEGGIDRNNDQERGVSSGPKFR